MTEQTSRSNLSKTSLLVATDLRAAERSIETAQRDLLTFMLNATEANRALGYSPAMAQSVLKPAAAALTSLLDCQDRLSGEAHVAAQRLARHLKLTVTDYGGSDGKPPVDSSVFTGASASPETVTAA